MIRRRITRRAELAELRDRAVADAAEIVRLRDKVTGLTARLDQAQAQADETLGKACLLIAVLRELGVSCVHVEDDGTVSICRYPGANR